MPERGEVGLTQHRKQKSITAQSHDLQSHIRDTSDASLDPGADASDQGTAVPTGSSGDAIEERTPLAATSLDIEMEGTTNDNAALSRWYNLPTARRGLELLGVTVARMMWPCCQY